MYFNMKSYLKSTRNHTVKHALNLFRQHAVANKISDQFEIYLWLDVVMIVHALILFKVTAGFDFMWKMRYV
jgi:hypothetical protein